LRLCASPCRCTIYGFTRLSWLCFAEWFLTIETPRAPRIEPVPGRASWLCFAGWSLTTETRRARRMQQDRNNRRLRDLCVSVVHSSAGWPPVGFAIHLSVYDIMTMAAVKGNPEILLRCRRLWQVSSPVGDLSPRLWARDVCLAIRRHPWYSVGVERKRNSQLQGPVSPKVEALSYRGYSRHRREGYRAKTRRPPRSKNDLSLGLLGVLSVLARGRWV